MSHGSNGGVNGKSSRRRPTRILEIVGNAIVGGMETYVRNLVARLPRDEFEIGCILPYESAYAASLRELGCSTYFTPLHDDPLWRSIEMGVGLVRELGIDVIHANLANAQTLAGVVGRLTGIPTAATIHSRTLTAQEISVARLTDMQLVTVCQETRSQALATGISSDRISLIHNGVDTARFHPSRDRASVRDAIGLAADAPLVGFVARMSWEKGPDKFIQAASRMGQQMPDVHFAMVGDGPALPHVRHLAQQHGIADRVHFLGMRDDVEDIYPAFDLLLQTSRSEAMPLALLEAMSSGVPIVAISTGGVAEVVEAGTTGVLVSPGDWPGVSSVYPGDWEGVACAALDLLWNRHRLESMGKAARHRAEAHFGVERTVAETAGLFRQLALREDRANGTWQPAVVGDKDERRVRLKAGMASPPGFASARATKN